MSTQNKTNETRIDIEKLFTIVADLKEADKEQKHAIKELENSLQNITIELTKFQTQFTVMMDNLEDKLNEIIKDRDKKFNRNTTLALVLSATIATIIQFIAFLIEHFAR